MNKLVLFDCDETLWESKDKDYISSVDSDLIRTSENSVERNTDGKTFTLKE